LNFNVNLPKNLAKVKPNQPWFEEGGARQRSSRFWQGGAAAPLKNSGQRSKYALPES